MGTNTNSGGYCEPEESETESVSEREWNREGERNWTFKLSSRKIDIFAYIPRTRPLVEVIKRNKAHLYGAPCEFDDSVRPPIDPRRSATDEEPRKSSRSRERTVREFGIDKEKLRVHTIRRGNKKKNRDRTINYFAAIPSYLSTSRVIRA